MLKKIFKYFSVLLLAFFSFFYTEKVTKIVRDNDPIMIKIKEYDSEKKVSSIDPIIYNDEYIMGINGCDIDVLESYSKMKSVGEFKEELIVMKEVSSLVDTENKYVIKGNNQDKNISIIFLIKNDISEELVEFIKEKNIKVNYFIDGKYLENNLSLIKFLSQNSNIYYLGVDENYKSEYMIYHNNLIGMNSSNESKYCFTNEKNSDILNLCTEYDMVTIKSDVIEDNVYKVIKENLKNGEIFSINSNDIDEIKVSINYILSKGYNIVSLEELLSLKNNCK